MRLDGKIVIVTGASSGIGWATAQLCGAEGAKVYASDVADPRSPFSGSDIHFIRHDVASENAWAEVTSHVIRDAGRIDVLVNNAGVGGIMADVVDEDLATWNQVIAVNLTGTFLGMRAVLPHMRSRKAGSIINISSIWGNAAVAFGAAYHATKGGIRQLTKHAAVAYGADNVRINSVHPGVVATPPVLEVQTGAATDVILAGSALGRMAQPVELAQAVLFLAGDESSFVTGSELVVDGGYLAKGS
ncbi:SDR family oxidoreductase [Polymorphobacter sp. PAMC 29334]|uniref:SDR family NAD(P)-dependent oxidoreductase n=1 Tax=Polymorphobacter sp. PAMC 29334 TaxID=2862331 RepID=UPI001C780B31|nr:SDR family oxidoreductase [Polymorphobacter sp. PAMC 29334]QYE36346.1 SDR family oxidoreductase [Polymorphobacter sp. PAMC 29334]